MNTKSIKILYIFLLLLMALAPTDLYAKTLSETEEEIMQLNAEYEEKTKELNESKLDQQATMDELNDIREQQVLVEADIAQTSDEISQAQAEIDELERKIPIMQEQADIIMVQTQRASRQNYLLNAIFDSNGASDAIRTVEAYSTLSEASGNIILELIDAQNELENQKSELEQKEYDLEIQQHQLELDEAYAEDMVAKLSAEVNAAEQQADETAIMLQAKEDQLELLKDAGCGPNDVYGIDCGTMDTATGFIRPIDYGYVTNEFNGFDGTTGGSTGHRGIDLATGYESYGAPIYPVAPGKVIISGTDYSGSQTGNWVTILHLYNGRNITSSYLHMQSAPLVSPGQMVGVSDQLGGIGNTGLSYGAHLHLGIFESEYYLVNPVDPRNYINFPPPYQEFFGRM